MVLLRGKRGEIPSDAIMLSEQEALEYQVKLMRGWKSKTDTFAFRFGGTILACASTAVGAYINNYYRRKFKLYNYGRFSSYLPIVFLPGALTFLIHTQSVTSQVALQNDCPVCLEMRASTIQTLAGFVFPAILAPLAAIPLAMQYATYDVPYITKEPMKVFRLWQKLTKPIANVLLGIFFGQALLASVVTYLEAKSVQKVNSKLAKLESDFEHYENVS